MSRKRYTAEQIIQKLRGEGADRAVASRVQHRSASQLARLPAAGTGGHPVGLQSQRRCNIEPGTNRGVRSRTVYVTSTQTSNVFRITGSCPADISGDGVVDVTDLLMVILDWNQTGSPADVTQDGVVDVADLLEVIIAWGLCS